MFFETYTTDQYDLVIVLRENSCIYVAGIVVETDALNLIVEIDIGVGIEGYRYTANELLNQLKKLFLGKDIEELKAYLEAFEIIYADTCVNDLWRDNAN